MMPIDYAKVAAGYGCVTYTARTLDELAAALRDARRQSVSTLIDIKAMPKTMTDGYGAWWNVGLAAAGVSEAQRLAWQGLLEHREKARQY